MFHLLPALLLPACLAIADVDGDGDGYAREDGDCDDVRADIFPGAAEICDDIDNDCDGEIDEEDASLDWTTAADWYADADGDGYGTINQPVRACYWAEGRAEVAGDCDDADSSVHPSASEVCDGIDNDCDGAIDGDDESLDPASLPSWYPDGDGDGYGDGGAPTESCEAPHGYVADGTDCDDGDSSRWPDAPEWVDGVDNDCDGTVDDETDIYDDDGDCFCEAGDCIGSINAGCIVIVDGDCDDSTDAALPGGEEVCDDIDNDCDGEADEDATDAPTWYVDADGDGHGGGSVAGVGCTQPDGAAATADDCDDADPDIGVITWYEDTDGDGYGDDATAVSSCEPPRTGLVSIGGDCDDADPDHHPGLSWHPDVDGDGFGDAHDRVDCEPDAVTDVIDGSDCDDTDSSVHPDADEVRADGIDQDCDGTDAGWVKISIGSDDFACGLDSEGELDCWGDDDDGEVADHPTDGGYVDVAAGSDHACALDADGYAVCWGDDSYNQSYAPTVTFSAVSASAYNTCGIRDSTGRAYCWGNSSDVITDAPTDILDVLLGCSYSHCGLTTAGRVRCWGSDVYGELLDDVPTTTGSVALAISRSGGCVLDGSGAVSCWGSVDVVDDVPDSDKFGPFSAVGRGQEDACVIDSAAGLYCWGDNSSLQSEPSGSFTDVFLGQSGAGQACAITTAGALMCWGSGNVVTDAP